MASIEHRPGTRGDRWRVVWREHGRKQSETFDNLPKALEFRGHVEAPRSDRWPHGWIKGVGWDEAESTAPTFETYAEKTIDARLRADARTKDEYRRTLRLHINPRIGALPLDKVDRFAVAGVAQAMLDAGKAPKTVSSAHGLLSSILADAVTDGLIPRNPARGALPPLPTVRGEDMHFLTHSEFAQLLGEVTEQWRPLVRLLAGTGLRWSEATALQAQDVDLLDKRVLHVRRAWKRRGTGYELGEPKTNRSRRTLDLSDELVELLIPLVAAKGPTELLFTTKQGQPVRHNNFYFRVWTPAVNRATTCTEHRDGKTPCGCPGTLTKQPRIHDLRHTHASWLIDAGVNLPEIQRRLGHESIQTTIDRYGHPSGARDAINAAVDAALRPV